MMKLIYVQIPAYRDAELAKTLLDLFAKADRPSDLRVRVMWQRGPEESLPAAVWRLPGLEVVEIAHEESRGCNWARSLLQAAWQGEPYTLLLDSHMRFTRGWDRRLCAMHEHLTISGRSAQPLITAYLPAYRPELGLRSRRQCPYKIYAKGRERGVLTQLTSYPLPFWRELRHPVRADFLSLHFLFADGAFNERVRFDPEIYFFGDEVVTGARAFMAGYDLYHPHEVMGWHCYDRASRVPHWDDHVTWRAQHARSLAKMRRLFSRGRRRPSPKRSLKDYEDAIGLSLLVPAGGTA